MAMAAAFSGAAAAMATKCAAVVSGAASAASRGQNLHLKDLIVPAVLTPAGYPRFPDLWPIGKRRGISRFPIPSPAKSGIGGAGIGDFRV